MTATFSTIVMSVASKRGLSTLAFCASISNHKCLMAMAQWQSVGLRPSELTNAFRATRRSQRHDQGDGDSGLGAFVGSKYLIHNCRGVSSNEAIGRDILQNHRTSGNNRTLANRYS